MWWLWWPEGKRGGALAEKISTKGQGISVQSKLWEEVIAMPLDDPTEAKLSLLDTSVASAADINRGSEGDASKGAMNAAPSVLDNFEASPVEANQPIFTADQMEPNCSGDTERVENSPRKGRKSGRTNREQVQVAEKLWTPDREPRIRRKSQKSERPYRKVTETEKVWIPDRKPQIRRPKPTK